mmetsp:Transcript_10192/g.18612  ORF Transcript_10192/g.18612 Transcript_10192/m.18612 type:complete len:1403 (-) Transcript_10192:641-4849(-)
MKFSPLRKLHNGSFASGGLIQSDTMSSTTINSDGSKISGQLGAFSFMWLFCFLYIAPATTKIMPVLVMIQGSELDISNLKHSQALMSSLNWSLPLCLSHLASIDPSLHIQYVPLELAYPTPMVERVLDDAKPTAVCTTLDHVHKLPAAVSEMAVVCEDDSAHEEHEGKESEWNALWACYQRGWADEGEEPNKVSLDDLAFVVYSSGTTGQPKGIANPHRAPAVSYDWRFRTLCDYGPGDVVACNVFFVWEALRPLMRGGTVLPIPSDDIYDGERLTSQIQRFNVTEILFTPSLLENMLITVDVSDVRQRLKTVKTIYLNGEVVSLALRRKVIDAVAHVRLFNLYSISECHEVAALDLTADDLDLSASDKFCPVGYPSTHCYIVDEECQPLPFGEAGELFVGGEMLARGYLNLPDLTATRFVPNPFLDDDDDARDRRMYRTGDRARFLPSGQLEILGRCDFMVKIRGYSVVLGAVETALVDRVKLSSCVVIADGEEGSEDKQLIAYIVRDQKDDDDGRLADWTIDSRNGACPEIRRAVDGHIAHYMVPSVYIEVESLPVSAVGAKLDRKALQAQTKDRRTMLRSLTLNHETHTTVATGHAATPHSSSSGSLRTLAKYLRVPRDSPLPDVESAMMALWECVLLTDDTISIEQESNFQEQGGHSLSAARLVSLVNKCFGVRLSAAKLFRDNYTVQKSSMEVVKQWSETTVAEDKTESVDCKGSWSVVEGPTEEQDNDVVARVRKDAILPVELTFPSSTAASITAGSARSIFLTGATGYLGVHILAQILAVNEMATVTCLVRSGDAEVVRKNCDKYGLKVDHSRVVLEKGDLSLAHFGMSLSDWNRVSASVDFIVHCGAMVSLTAPYDGKMREINVGGTLETIKLAAACREGTSMVYVSSNGIFPSTSDEVFMENEGISCLPDRLDPNNGYGLSKWAAEQMVTEANAKGLSTLAIRFGNIGWDSATAHGNALDFQALIVKGCLRVGKALDLESWNFECTPVDFASKSLVALASDAGALKEGFVLNCVQDDFTPFKNIFQYLSGVSGSPLPAVNFESWSSALEETAMGANDDSVMALFSFIAGMEDCQSYLKNVPKLDCSAFDATLEKIGSPLKRKGLVSKSYFETYLRSIVSAGDRVDIQVNDAVPFDPSGRGPVTGPLAGQVAVVTGASSGIGRAIVSALVSAGCHVAMGARRVEELEKTKEIVMNECPGTTSKAVIVKTDVTKLSDVQALVEKAEQSLGPVDILVNVAGVMYFTLMQNVNWDQWERTVDVNCKGTMYGIGTILPSMLARGKGHIVNITSDAGRKAFAGLGVYSGSKFFVEAVSQALRAETASSGLRVTCIQPGNVATPLLSTSTDSDALKAYGEPTGAKVLEPADIGRAVVYAVTQPEWCAVNEILVEPREEPA